MRAETFGVHNGQIAGLHSFLRQLQRQFHSAVLLLVHHARKDSGSSRSGTESEPKNALFSVRIIAATFFLVAQ